MFESSYRSVIRRAILVSQGKAEKPFYWFGWKDDFYQSVVWIITAKNIEKNLRDINRKWGVSNAG